MLGWVKWYARICGTEVHKTIREPAKYASFFHEMQS